MFVRFLVNSMIREWGGDVKDKNNEKLRFPGLFSPYELRTSFFSGFGASSLPDRPFSGVFAGPRFPARHTAFLQRSLSAGRA